MAAAVVHFESVREINGKPCRFISCVTSRYAGGKATTTDRAAVTCRRCASALGIEPAARPEAQNPTGTCQACFRQHKVVRGRIALHGYERPGYGEIVGRCFGSGAAPYEVSCEVTRHFLGRVESMLERARVWRDDLGRDAVAELSHQNTYSDYRRGVKRTFCVTVRRGDAPRNPTGVSSLSEEWARVAHPGWAQVREREVRRAEQNVAGLTGEVAFLADKVNTWQPRDLLSSEARRCG